MLGLQKSRLTAAVLEHERARGQVRAARSEFQQQRAAFLAKPANLLFPFAAGILVTAGQIRNVPEGVNRLPFMNIAKAGVGAYALLVRLKNLRLHHTNSSETK